MNKPVLTAILPLIFASAIFMSSCSSTRSPRFPDPPAEPGAAVGTQTAVLAGGCFWGMEGVFERLKGVVKVVSGYSGGKAEDAFYEAVSMGKTGHAESVQITYNPGTISYGMLLKVFFSIAHDPTQDDALYPDVGTQYRSVIFYSNDEQKRTAETYIAALAKSGIFTRPIATQVTPLEAFYPAEEYHQHFVDRHPSLPYVVSWDLPMIERLKKLYPQLLAS